MHLGGELVVRDWRVLLCQVDDDAQPRLLIEGEELSLHQAETLVSVLTQLLDQASAALRAREVQV